MEKVILQFVEEVIERTVADKVGQTLFTKKTKLNNTW